MATNSWKYIQREFVEVHKETTPNNERRVKTQARIWWFIMAIIKDNYGRYFWYIIFDELEWHLGPQDLGQAVFFFEWHFFLGQFVKKILEKEYSFTNSLFLEIFFAKNHVLNITKFGQILLEQHKNCQKKKRKKRHWLPGFTLQLCNIKKLSKFSKKIALRKHTYPRFSQNLLVKNNEKKLLHGGWDHLKVTQLHTWEGDDDDAWQWLNLRNMQKFVLTHAHTWDSSW
jgi:hypothetical protein